MVHGPSMGRSLEIFSPCFWEGPAGGHAHNPPMVRGWYPSVALTTNEVCILLSLGYGVLHYYNVRVT